MIKTKKIISLVLILAILFTSGVMIVQEVHAEGTSTGVHDIFVAKDDSKLERFKERVLNRLLYLDKAIDVSDLDIAPNEIQYSVNGMDLTGIYAAREIVRKNPFYSTAATTGFPEFTYKDNGCVATVKYTYHPAWTQDFVAKVIASYDEVMALIKPGDSDFAKILKIHDWIVKNVSYGMSTLYYDFGVGALANRKAVCAGYAQCYQFLLSQVGIDSVYIAANTKKEPHAWNLVKLDGHWFHVDCTWDRGLGVNPNVKHTYFMLSDAEFNADGVHSEDWKKPEKGYPTNNVCTIQNKFYASNTDIATDVQIAANPIVLDHKFDPSSTYSHSDTEHWRTCVAGVEVRKPHDGSPCTVCGYTAPSVTSYTVTLTNDGNGTASASATSAAAGTEITLTAVPNTGYHFKEWKVISGSMTITNNKFTMPAENVEVKAVFEKDAPTTCSLTTQVNGGNGTISASKTGLTAGSTETITFTPDAGYEIDTVTVNGTATSVSGNTLNVTMNENKTVVVTYKAVEYNITVTDGKATVDAGSEISKAAQGTIVTLTANAAPSGKVFDKWEVVGGGITLADANSATTTFTMPASAVSVKATYKNIPVVTYTVSFGANGGTGSMADATGISGEYTLPANGFTAPDGKQFKGWATSASGTVITGTSITVSADTTLYAIWTNIGGGGGSSSGGGSYVPKTQKPEIKAAAGGKTVLSKDGTTLTITADAGKVIDKVLLNGKDMGAVSELKGLKTGDKVEVIFKDQVTEPTKEQLDKAAKEATGELVLAARSAKLKNGSVKIMLKDDLKAITDAGYTVKYKFYRSTKKSAGYKAVLTKKAPTYVNTYGKQGTMYYYKARVMVYDKDGNFVAQTALKQCKYANRLWTK